MKCLICKIDVTDIAAQCHSRTEDGALVCPVCADKLKRRDRDALDKWFDMRVIGGGVG